MIVNSAYLIKISPRVLLVNEGLGNLGHLLALLGHSYQVFSRLNVEVPGNRKRTVTSS